MTWFCRECQVQNAQKFDYCRTCQQHWSAVWTQPVKRRSRSKSAKKKEKEPQDKVDEDQWKVFPEKVPWIPTTPSTRLGTKTAETPLGGQAKETGTAQAPCALPAAQPKEEVLTDEDKKKLTHLRGLQSMNVELPTALTVQLEALESKEKAMHSTKALSHGHLNRLTKVKSQVAAQVKKIEGLDQEWSAFVQRTLTKIQHHATLYQQCRGEMMETYNLKLEEFRKLRLELTQASRSLMEQQLEEPAAVEAVNVDEQMQALTSAITSEGMVAPIVDLSEEDDIMEIQGSQEESDGPTLKDGKAQTKAPFRGALSPQKVAHLHLKVKKDKDKDKTDK